MKPLMRKIEHAVDKSIPYALLLLLVIIIGEIFFQEIAHHYEVVFTVIDGIVVGIFVVDLGFKFNKVRKVKPFVKRFCAKLQNGTA